MKYKITDIKIPANSKEDVLNYVKNKFKISDLKDFKIYKRSIDARNKSDVKIIYQVVVETNKDLSKFKNVTIFKEDKPIVYNEWKFKDRPVIVGFGPAGMFCALYLARCNAKPIIIERGSCVEQRTKDIEEFYQNKKLNTESNVLFGEGGAGTFSDGKLTTNLNDPLIKEILKDFHKFGASEEVTYDAMPHVGSDVLCEVVKNLRNEIISLGGEIYFNTLFTNYENVNDELIVETSKAKFVTKHLFLGLGHSAYDTIKTLYNKGLKMEPKSFSVGVRVEHKASYIDYLQYADFAKYLPRAYYKIAVHLKERSVYSFCMCPGGYVMATTNDENSIVTNGMSNSKRDASNSNAALLVDINPSDYYKGNVLDGFEFQKSIERLAFEVSHDYKAPANLMKEFVEGTVASTIRSVTPSYPHGVVLTDLNKVLPNYVCDALKEGILKINERMPGFYHEDAVLTGVESRSSSPVRILRNENKVACDMVYPIGEGAGYAGGITSAALDGIKSAMKCMEEVYE